MLHEPWDLARWNRASTSLGASIWLAAALAALRGWLALDLLEVLLLLALFVVTPLALGLVVLRDHVQAERQLDRLVVLLQPVAALIAGTSFLPRTGLFAATLAAVWLGLTVLAALLGLGWLVHARDLAAVCRAMALVYLPIGGAWLVLARLGAQPLGFSPAIVALTAVHFHFVPLAALVLTCLTGQQLRQTGHAPRTVRIAYRVAAVGMLASPALVAAGHIVTQTTGMRLVESAAALVLALSLLIVAILGLAVVVPATHAPLARMLLAVSGASVVVAMLFASAFALGAATEAWSISIPTMVATHGVLNALGFGLCGLLGWRLRLVHGHDHDHVQHDLSRSPADRWATPGIGVDPDDQAQTQTDLTRASESHTPSRHPVGESRAARVLGPPPGGETYGNNAMRHGITPALTSGSGLATDLPPSFVTFVSSW